MRETRKPVRHNSKKNGKFEIAGSPRSNRRVSTPIYSTGLGSMYFGPLESVLKTKALCSHHGQVQLIFTSPPFPLARKKKYGNLIGDEYVEWLASFALLLKDFLTPNGSIVIEIGNSWEPGKPVMSTAVLKALLHFLETGGFHLCQEFVWYNPARLPSPAQWVNIERIRVKDAFTRIWWMSPTERPKADNRNVLTEYSRSMKRLLATGSYNSGKRPSEFVIGEKSFLKDNGGAIPPNVLGLHDAPSPTNFLKVSNTRSSDRYQLFCREHDIEAHPARMPTELAEFFINFLTDERDLVFDPFAGSNTTGATAQRLGRRWISVEANWPYVVGSLGNLDPKSILRTSSEIRI